MSTKLTAEETVAALAHLGISLSKPTLWQWKHRGHLSSGHGYDPDEIAAYLARRPHRPTREPARRLAQRSNTVS